MARTVRSDADMLDVRSAAALVGRPPETVRRWVWSGRLPARRRGRRLVMAREDVEAIAASDARGSTSLAAWTDCAHAVREAAGASTSGPSAADLVIEDRAQRARPTEARAG